MELTFEQVGLFFQIFGVLIVLFSQVWFGCKAWRKYGGLKKAFFVLLSVARIMGDELFTEGKLDVEKLRKLPEEMFKDTFPEKWILASYLREDLWTTAIGLVVTLLGLFLELLYTLHQYHIGF